LNGMNVEFEEALTFYERLTENRNIPSLHPFYIRADSKRDPSLTPTFFVFQEGGEFFYHGFLLGKIESTHFYDIQSPYGYGGPIASSEDPEFLSVAWEHYKDWCLRNNVLVEFVRFHPLLQNWKYYNGDVISDRTTVWIDLEKDDLLASYLTRSRTAIKKAQKAGLYIEWVDPKKYVDLFFNYYSDAMVELGADESYIFPKEYHRELLSWDNSRLALCKWENKVVGASLFMLSPSIMEYHLSFTLLEGKKLSANNLILHEAALLAKRLGLKKLHLGGGTDKDNRNPLLFFKEGFSDQRSLFRIGKEIYMQKQYNDLMSEWLRNKGRIANRVLFYRFNEEA
jgi:hypothetical protein